MQGTVTIYSGALCLVTPGYVHVSLGCIAYGGREGRRNGGRKVGKEGGKKGAKERNRVGREEGTVGREKERDGG